MLTARSGGLVVEKIQDAWPSALIIIIIIMMIQELRGTPVKNMIRCSMTGVKSFLAYVPQQTLIASNLLLTF